MPNEAKEDTSKTEITTTASSSSGKALVFISHDIRDAEIAEAFSKLLSSVSAGVLKSFRSSDKKGNQGIEYGVDWYPEIMKKLKDASDVVCLLTPFSVDRPWILYEAGVAKGQLDTPVHGLALGIPLTDASTGPFAQFQNSDDDIDAITSLVMQLVSKIPNAEPDREVVVAQVETFKASVAQFMESQGHKQEKPRKLDNTSVAKLFEEIKVMYQDLPSRIESRVSGSPSRQRTRRRIHPGIMEEFMQMGKISESPYLGILMYLGLYRDDFPWIYDIAYQMFQAYECEDVAKAEKLAETLVRSAEMMRQNPMFEEYYDSKEHFIFIHELPRILDRLVTSTRKSRRRRVRLKTAEQEDSSDT